MDDLTLRKAVELAITTEQLGADFYARMERKFSDDEELKQVFSQLTKDEKVHEIQFKKILEKVPDDKPEDQQWEKYQFLRATAISEFFRKEAFLDTGKLKTKEDILGRALAFEKSTLQYYQAIADILGENSELKAIIAAEKSHVTNLMRTIIADAKFRGVNYDY